MEKHKQDPVSIISESTLQRLPSLVYTTDQILLQLLWCNPKVTVEIGRIMVDLN